MLENAKDYLFKIFRKNYKNHQNLILRAGSKNSKISSSLSNALRLRAIGQLETVHSDANLVR